MDDQSHLDEQMPANIGRYKVLESIGFGAMGAVYKAFDPLIKRTLAIKTIRLDIPRQSPQYKSFIERFYHEARISGTLAHPNIVTLFDIGEEGGVPYLAMEFVEGETIAALLEKGVRFKPERVIALASQIGAALDYAHTKGVIHRDIKPSNLIFHDVERVKVTDFGIAKLVDAEMTQSGTLLGTPSYMSPEQAMGEKLDGRSDIFSLGVCAFEMLSGEQPFPGANVTSILYKLVHVDPIEPANLEMHGLVPQKWHEVFGRVLAKKPDDRYQTAGAFVQDLEYCLGAWFGSVGEQTLSEANQPGAEPTATMPRIAVPAMGAPAPADADGDATTLLPNVAATKEPVGAPPSVAALVEEPSPATIAVKPGPPPDDDVPATVMLKAPVDLRAAASEPATVLLRATPAATPAPAPDPAEATIVMQAPVMPAKATPPAAAPAGESTVLMNSPVVSVPVPGEATVLMMTPAAESAAARPAEEPTGKMAIPPPTTPMARPPAPPKPPKAKAALLVPAVPEPTATAAVPPAPPKRGVPVGVVLGGIGAAFLLIVLGGGYFVWKNHNAAGAPDAAPTAAPSAVAPTPAPVVAKGSLKVESQPAGGIVQVNGETKGTAPLDFADLPLGVYEVKVDLKGYDTKTQSVTLTEAEPRIELKVALSRPAAVMGLADFASNPPGASLTVDGAKAGATPVVGYKLRPGSHAVEMTKEGFERWSGTVNVQAGAPAKIDATLKIVAKATPAPTPTPETVDANKVYTNTPAEVDTVAKKNSGPSVSYPQNAPRLRSGDSVSVTVSFVIDEQGDVSDVKVLESGGKILDDAVVSTVQKWKYAPAVKKGIKVKARHTVKQTFRAG
jgi:serine/threonine-protein kinase